MASPRFPHRRPSSLLAFSPDFCLLAVQFRSACAFHSSNEFVFTNNRRVCTCTASSRTSTSVNPPIMTSSSSTPDISTLSLSSKPSQQRLHDTYDYEGSGSGNGRNPYHFSTSPPIPAQSQYNPLGISQSPLKNKTMRGGLPSVRFSSILPLPAQI